ncbi:MAG: hypothetical protein RLZZ153_411 [Pseudomonadota bacterium]|jgi:hypothetical protein
MIVKYCRLTSTKPKYVTKRYGLSGGELVKNTSANVSEGHLAICEVRSASEFAGYLKQLGHDQCHIYGLPPRNAALVTEERWHKLGCPEDPLPRSQEVFSWSGGPGVMLLDRDGPKDGERGLTKKQLFQLLLGACPQINTADLVWWPSASSHICKEGDDLTGLRGQHFYIFVKDASDIERAGKALNDRLWALGHGHYEVSKAGNLLKRGVFDESVWQSNHIDFAAGASCGDGLVQQRGEPLVLDEGEDQFRLLDTRIAIPDLNEDERKLASDHQERSKATVAKAAEEQRAQWMAGRVSVMVQKNPGLSQVMATAIVKRAAETRELTADFEIIIMRKVGQEEAITVSQALREPNKYDGLLTLDPLEPDYGGRRQVGKLLLTNGRPVLHSFAHGGCTYRLRSETRRIQLIAGKTNQAVDELLDEMRKADDLFDFGHKLVQVGGCGSTLLLTDSTLKYIVGGMVQFWARVMRDNGPADVLRDPPLGVCKTVIDLRDERGLKKLNGLITAPTLRPNGTLLQKTGYDKETCLFYNGQRNGVRVPLNPTRAEAALALRKLWEPFSSFPFCSGIDRAVHLAAVLTAAVRAVLPAAPGFAYDAPTQGSGKTLLARCVGVLAQGDEPSVWPHTAGTNDEETRKRIFTVLSYGKRVLIWDNVVGAFDSAALASCMTSPTYTDRILGKSDSTTVPNRMMLVLTGNNIQLQGEMPRRVLISRIDPQTERPFAREFSLDPFAHCRAHRQSMIEAALTLIRGFLTHGCKQPITGKLASFEEWDAWVRRTVIYADELWPGQFGDVMDVVKANQAVDPELETLVSLLSSWHDVFGSRPVHAAEVIQKATGFLNLPGELKTPLQEAILGLPLRDARNPSAKSLGRYLSNRRDRRLAGYLLKPGPKVDDKQTWCVERLGTV